MKDWSDFFFMCAIVSVAVMILFAQVYLVLYECPTDNPLCLIITVCGCIALDSFLLALFTRGNNEK